MNANHSFRTSITVLTVTTTVGIAVMLFSGFSQFRLRPSINDKALVSTANQKLRNRFGEFYPAEPRNPSAQSPSPHVIHSASPSSTFDEVITTTSEYDHSEVVTSWSPGASPGVPQVSVPVTINVNNGELMAQLIETRESLAEVKAQQSSIRQDQRVFSYQVHKNAQDTATDSTAATLTAESVTSAASKPDKESSVPSASGPAGARVVSQQNVEAAKASHESASGKRHPSSEEDSASHESAGRSTSRMRSISESGTVHQATQSAVKAVPSADDSSSSSSKPATDATSTMDSATKTEADFDHEFETIRETSETTNNSTFNIEEKVSFEPVSQPPAVPVDDGPVSVPVIEPISYSVEETVEESRSVTVSENSAVQFGSLEKSTAAEAPASLPELSFEEALQENSSELPVLSTERSASDKSSGEQSLPNFFVDQENSGPAKGMAKTGPPAELTREEKHGRTRQQLATAFAAVRGLPPEDLFGDRSTPFVLPIEPAEPAAEESAGSLNVVSSDLKIAADSLTHETLQEATPPRISFGDSSTDGLVVRPSSAASPVDLEFGEASVASPALAHSENPGGPETPAMHPAEKKEERWHKYRSRIYQKQSSSPSTPVPPVPEIARMEVAKTPAPIFQEPSPVPPSLETSLLESDSDQTISDSPLMFPDEDGTTEIAQNSDSEKLNSATLPPIPKADSIQELVPVPELQLPVIEAEADQGLVYEPQPVMDRLNQISTEMNAPPVFSSSPPAMAQRKMPPKSANKKPFETTYRRIHKRVAWMTDAMNLPEKKTAQQQPVKPRSPMMQRPQFSSHPPTQSHGPAVARKNSPSKPMHLPKLNVPKFTVQNFALPNVNFRAIQPPSFQMPVLDTPDWLACPPDVMAPVRNSTAVHRVISTMQFAGQSKVLN